MGLIESLCKVKFYWYEEGVENYVKYGALLSVKLGGPVPNFMANFFSVKCYMYVMKVIFPSFHKWVIIEAVYVKNIAKHNQTCPAVVFIK